jgi:hypothetical protein
MKAANYAPVYCAMYPELAEIARRHGYALAIHGSMARDADLICVPWAAQVSEPQAVIDEMAKKFVIKEVGGEPTLKEHGRVAHTLSICWGECAIDLSFTPRAAAPAAEPALVQAAPEPDFWEYRSVMRYEDGTSKWGSTWYDCTEPDADDLANQDREYRPVYLHPDIEALQARWKAAALRRVLGDE